MESLLILDDDMTFARRLALSFQKRGYRVEFFQDGDSALAAQRQKGFDAAVIDLRLENESGLDLVSRLRAL